MVYKDAVRPLMKVLSVMWSYCLMRTKFVRVTCIKSITVFYSAFHNIFHSDIKKIGGTNGASKNGQKKEPSKAGKYDAWE